MGLFTRRSKPSRADVSAAPPPAASGDAEARVVALGTELLERARGHKAGLFSAQFYSDALMDWSMKDPNFKVQMFRFVDTFPVLRTPEAVYDHLRDYLEQPGVTVPAAIGALIKAGGLVKGMAASQIRSRIEGMAARFIAGRDASSAVPGLRKMWDQGIAFSVDLLGETCVSEAEADAFAAKYRDLIENLPGEVAGWPAREVLERDHLGPIPRVNVSVKVSALSSRVDPIDPEGSIRGLMVRLVPLLETAARRGVFVNFDMEHFAFKDLTIDLFTRCCEAVPFEGGLAMQAYLRSGVEDARRLGAWAKTSGRVVTVRLVKGAYWDAETIKSEMHGWACPVWPEKWRTDACFEAMTEALLDAAPGAGGAGGVKLALGSHNARSIGWALASLERRGLPRSAVELQMLHGMADQLKHAASEMGLRVREYVPVGEMVPGMAYLVRRLLENTSNESWLKAGFLDKADPAVLLARPGGGRRYDEGLPAAASDEPLQRPERHGLSPVVAGVGDGRSFVNEPMRDFADARARAAFASAVSSARVPAVKNDATAEDARSAVGAALSAFPAWRDTPARTRAAVLTRAASLMRARRDELSAVMIKEAGKTWREADADTCEAVDFCEYYARCAAPMFERSRLGRFIGELDEEFCEPRGVAVVISPWNFPLAICCGMTAAALVTGNTAVVKPAEQTPGIASIMGSIFREALLAEGVPAAVAGGVLRVLAGPGETVGAALVRDPRVSIIAFTGSRDVGLDIQTAAAPGSPFADPSVRSRATHLKHVVCEMGGKNAVIVDTSADWDEAVLGVRQSAFGFQGQKCSACSRVIVVDPEGPGGPAVVGFRERLIEASRALVIGDPAKPGSDVGPVIDAEAKTKIEGFVARAKASGLSWWAGEMPPGPALTVGGSAGWSFVAPHVFWTVGEDHELAREEIFGPVLAVMHASDYGDALRIANALPYKLTGGVFTRKPSHIERAKREFRVGNLYINRGITGALVARQPFGGFGMSGGGTKAGGSAYLRHFVDPRAVCENTLRRGFAPEL